MPSKISIPKIFFWGLALVAGLSAGVAAAAPKLQDVYNPAPIQVPAGKSPEQVRQAIRQALAGKGFQFREIAPGHIEGKYTRAGRGGLEHMAVFNVRFDTKAVRITYKDSKDLNYDPQTKQIHPTYNKWIKTAESHIRSKLEGN